MSSERSKLENTTGANNSSRSSKFHNLKTKKFSIDTKNLKFDSDQKSKNELTRKFKRKVMHSDSTNEAYYGVAIWGKNTSEFKKGPSKFSHNLSTDDILANKK